LAAAGLPEVSEQAVAEMGTTYGIPQMNGFVFIEGCYIPAPYTVTRKGNAIFINRIQIEQPVSWSAITGVPEQPAKSLDANGDFEVVAPANDAASAQDSAAPEAPIPAPHPVKSIDDLFADDDPAAAKDASAAPPAPAPAPEGRRPLKSIDDLFGDDAQPAAPAQGGLAASGARTRTPDDVKRLKEELRAQLDAQRKNYEQALAKGEIFFFSQQHGRLNGNYGSARTLMGVLPTALRYAKSPQDLQQRLVDGGVYFVDMAVCAALYKNRLTFPLLEERLKRIEEAEALEAARKARAQAR